MSKNVPLFHKPRHTSPSALRSPKPRACPSNDGSRILNAPKHNGRFDIRDGVPIRAPVCVALRPYPAKVEGGRILVNLPD
jgi:hypothetical protein